MTDSHSISGSISTSVSDPTYAVTWTDKGADVNQMYASGTKSTTGDVYTFTDTESSSDNFVLNKSVPGSMNGAANDSTVVGSSMTGSTSTGPSGSTFGYTEQSQSTNQSNDSGNVTVGTIVSPIALLTSSSLAVQIVLTGPTATMTTATVGHSTSTSGGNDGANFTETDAAGQGSTAGTPVAGEVGSSPLGSAEHLGTSPNSLDTSSGLLSGLGGEAVHAMSFTTAASNGTGLDRFLLALCHRRLSRSDEARRWYGLGLDWLKHNGADKTLRAVVIEATAEIEGRSRGDAEARLFLDPAFPAHPFAR